MSAPFSRSSVPTVAPALGRPATYAVRRLYRLLEAAVRIRAERRRLAALDDNALKDIGLSRSLAMHEADRAFLDVPEHRIRRR